jgi:Family of unknown function (DUF6519)
LHGDFSRLSFSRSKHYSAVWAQQGRVQLDADLNEQTAIVLDYLRTLAIDFIGPFGGHVARAGFDVRLTDAASPRIEFGPGHYYVYGLRCDASPGGRPYAFTGVELPDAPFIVELLVWEQTIGPIQDPTLAEPALGPGAPDTTLRSQVRWKPRLSKHMPGADAITGTETVEDILDAFVSHNDSPRVLPVLQARASGPPGAAEDPGTLPAGSAYRGVENQLYRVEIHSPGPGGSATFKWSRDNGSVELALESLKACDGGDRLKGKLSGPAREARGELQTGDWVELVDDDWSPQGHPGGLLRVLSFDHLTREVELGGEVTDIQFEPRLHPFLRRWDQRPRALAPDNAILVTEVDEAGLDGGWLDLEDGVQVRFPRVDGRYERGDYWTVPGRVATGGVLWPRTEEGPVASPPHGPDRYRAPLALVRSVSPHDITDLRVRFTHLAWPVEVGDDYG